MFRVCGVGVGGLGSEGTLRIQVNIQGVILIL